MRALRQIILFEDICPFNWSARRSCLKHGAMVLVDTLFVPLLLLLALTQYRKADLFAHGSGLPSLDGPTEYAAACRQTALLLCDLLLAPPLLLLALTRVRWRGVARRALSPFAPTSGDLACATLRQVGE